MSNLIAHALIKNSMDELLSLKRTLTEQGKENYEGGKWDIPGGTVEKLEFPSSTAVRETKEETNLDVTVERILYEKSNMDTKKNQVFTTLIYLCSLSGTVETIELDVEENVVKSVSVPNLKINGELRITKLDSDKNPIEGVTFEIYDENEDKICTITTDDTGYASTKTAGVSLNKGTYYYKEVDAPYYVIKNTELQKFVLEILNKLLK